MLVATPGRLLDHFQNDYAKLEGLEILVLDEADRMLDMGFLPDVRRVLQHLPRPEQTLFFSATLPQPIVELAGEMLREPARLNVERKSAPATGITQAVYPVQENLKPYLLVELLRRGDIKNVLVFTRTNTGQRLPIPREARRPCDASRQPQPGPATDALSRFKSGDLQVLGRPTFAPAASTSRPVARHQSTSPTSPRTTSSRRPHRPLAEMVGDAFTFVSDEETAELQAIDARSSPGYAARTVEGFDYAAEPAERRGSAPGSRIAAIRDRAPRSAPGGPGGEEGAARGRGEGRLDQKAKRSTEGAPPRAAAAPGSGQARPGAAGQQPQRQGERQGGEPGQPLRGAPGASAPQADGGQGGAAPVAAASSSLAIATRRRVGAREVDPTTKPTRSAWCRSANAFSTTRFNRFRRYLSVELHRLARQ